MFRFELGPVQAEGCRLTVAVRPVCSKPTPVKGVREDEQESEGYSRA